MGISRKIHFFCERPSLRQGNRKKHVSRIGSIPAIQPYFLHLVCPRGKGYRFYETNIAAAGPLQKILGGAYAARRLRFKQHSAVRMYPYSPARRALQQTSYQKRIPALTAMIESHPHGIVYASCNNHPAVTRPFS